MSITLRTQLVNKIWAPRRCRGLSTAPPTNNTGSQRQPAYRLPTSPARTRFAPSPTGHLHLGSLRTALFNYLTAKATGGQFLLRLEDTDKKRTVRDAESRLYEDLRWAGLQWDEGPDIGGPCGPYKQSERTISYQKHATQLLDSRHAYRCFCSADRLNELTVQRKSLGLPSDYDRTCEGIPKEESDERASHGESHIIRLRMPEFPPQYSDCVYGVIGQLRQTDKPQSQRAQPTYEDPVLIKSDGLPTYHLANVVDDHLMGITHVIRAVEWMSSTPKHMVLYNAFNWEPPVFAHVGLLQDSSRQKLSKRDGALEIRSYRDEGIFPEALVNHVALFGWSHRLGDDFMDLQCLVKNFNLKFTKGNTITTSDKLNHLQKRYAQKYVQEGGKKYDSMFEGIYAVAVQHMEAHPESRLFQSDDLRHQIRALLSVDAANYTSPQTFFERNIQLLCHEPRQAYGPRRDHQSLKDSMDDIRVCFINVPPHNWGEPGLKQAFDQLIIKLTDQWIRSGSPNTNSTKDCRNAVQHFLRWALTGGRPGPVLMVTMSLLGRDVSLMRIEDAVASFRA